MQSGEKLHIFIRQPLFYNLTPSFILATNRRIIIIKNSFWGIYAGRNIFSSTVYNSIPYRQVTSVILSRGILTCSITVRLQGMLDAAASNEGEINGIWSKDALNFVNFAEHMVEHHAQMQAPATSGKEAGATGHDLHSVLMGRGPVAHNGVHEIDLSNAVELANEYGTKIIWLGAEPAAQLGPLLGIDPAIITKIDPDKMLEMGNDVAQLIGNHMLLDYNGNVSRHLAAEIRARYGVETYAIKGGMLAAAHGSRKELYRTVSE